MNQRAFTVETSTTDERDSKLNVVAQQWNVLTGTNADAVRGKAREIQECLLAWHRLLGWQHDQKLALAMTTAETMALDSPF
eukprot:scaffold2089_cov55-Attheya_sp.AAC.2